MKRIILNVLMVLMLSTPCFAEVETEGLSSIEGTLWRNYLIGFDFPHAPLFFFFSDSLLTGYYKDTIYYCDTSQSRCDLQRGSTYIDSPVLAVAFSPITPDSNTPPFGMHIALIQPYGFGMTFYYTFCLHAYCGAYGGVHAAIGLMFKTDDNWTPSDE